MAVTKTYYTGVDGQNYVPNYESEFDMIGKIAHQFMKDVSATNPLNVFENFTTDNGDTIEQSVTKFVASRAYDATGANALTPDRTAKFAVRYFKDWSREVYQTTVDKAELRKVLIQNRDVADVAERIVSVLGQSDIDDKFNYTKGLLRNAVTNSWELDVTNNNPIDIANNQDYKGLLKAIKDTVKGMQYVSTTYNGAGIKMRSNPDDLYIIMPYDIKNALDVDELAGVFNLDKADIKDKIIETDDLTNKYIHIVDKHALIVATRLYELENQKNADSLTWNYFLHVDRMYAFSQLFNSAYIPYV